VDRPIRPEAIHTKTTSERVMPRALKVCSCRTCPEHPGSCPILCPSGRCPRCTRTADIARGSRQQRGYNADYDRARTQALDHATHCETCGEPFTADNPATGGHRLARRHGGTTAHGIGPQCRRCNYGWRRTNT
jgi:hypothetical protein